MHPLPFSQPCLSRPCPLGKVLAGRFASRRQQWTFLGKAEPIERVVDAAGWLPVLLAAAVARGRAPGEWLRQERFGCLAEPTGVHLPCGFFLDTAPDPARWALPIAACWGMEPVDLDAERRHWENALRGHWGDLDLSALA